MKFIIAIIVIALIVSALDVIWPVLLIIAALLAAWKLYEAYYYNSSAFKGIKQRIDAYINDSNFAHRF